MPGDKSAHLGGLFVDETGVYVAINTNEELKLWKDGVVTDVTATGPDYDEWCEDICVYKGCIYLGGYCYEGTHSDKQHIGPTIWSIHKDRSIHSECIRGNGTGERCRFYISE